MTFTQFYSKKILSRRQSAVLYGSVIICIIAFTYTYFATEYIIAAMLGSIADTSPHIRIFVSSQAEVDAIVEKYKEKALRIGTGIVVEKNFYVQSRKMATEIGKPGEIFFAGAKRIKIVGYPFDHESYRPPILLENVYSRANRELSIRRPQDEPVRIITDPDAKEQQENWAIISKGITSIFPLGPSQFGDLFEITTTLPNIQKKIKLRSAGYLSDSPLALSSESAGNVVYTKMSLVRKIASPAEQQLIVDISLRDRLAADALANKILHDYPAVSIETWTKVNPIALPFLRGIRLSAYAGVSAIVLLSIIGISVLIRMLVMEKSKQLAILFAMGYDSLQLRLVFLYVGLRVAVISIISGGGIGYIFARLSLPYWNGIVANFSGATSPCLIISLSFLGGAALLILALCLLAAWFPTGTIVKSDPINNLRNE